jgi:hypothetical protein
VQRKAPKSSLNFSALRGKPYEKCCKTIVLDSLCDTFDEVGKALLHYLFI